MLDSKPLRILDNGEACSVWGAAPCYIDGETTPVPSPTEETPMAPTTPGTAPTTDGEAHQAEAQTTEDHNSPTSCS